MTDILWRPDTDQARLSPLLLQGDVYRPDILAEIESSIDSLSPKLRELSNKIHGIMCSPLRSPKATDHGVDAVPYYC
jgi:hypothetical protein